MPITAEGADLEVVRKVGSTILAYTVYYMCIKYIICTYDPVSVAPPRPGMVYGSYPPPPLWWWKGA